MHPAIEAFERGDSAHVLIVRCGQADLTDVAVELGRTVDAGWVHTTTAMMQSSGGSALVLMTFERPHVEVQCS